jgi:hypothetical protein
MISSAGMKWAAAVVVLILIAGLVIVFGTKREHTPAAAPVATTTPAVERIGTSVLGRAITAYTYGSGEKRLVLVGGIHGGYEWNAVLLAYTFMDYLAAHPEAVPAGERVTVIPDLNPDGVYAVTGVEGRFTAAQVSTDEATLAAGRFNADHVDLNRNFDCGWQPTGTWRSKTVSAGSAAFSEPEARALRDYALKTHPVAVVFWHSQANSVYSSSCGAPVSAEDAAIAKAYASASGYPVADTFTAYAVTGDAGDWLSTVGIPAIAVELSTHTGIEWEKNLAGIRSLMTALAAPSS